MATVWPDDKTTILAKKEILYTGPVGLTLWLAGITFIDRLDKSRSKDVIVDLAERINRENVSPKRKRPLRRRDEA